MVKIVFSKTEIKELKSYGYKTTEINKWKRELTQLVKERIWNFYVDSGWG